MKILSYSFLVLFLVITSCSGSNKWFRSGEKKNASEGTSIKTTLMPATPIKEVEEKLVANDQKAPDTHKYFVVIGSFRSSGNARTYQSQIAKDGFASEILKNDAGLYRVSVKATDDITEARNEVRRIWAKFPKYSDTWMLIRKTE